MKIVKIIKKMLFKKPAKRKENQQKEIKFQQQLTQYRNRPSSQNHSEGYHETSNKFDWQLAKSFNNQEEQQLYLKFIDSQRTKHANRSDEILNLENENQVVVRNSM